LFDDIDHCQGEDGGGDRGGDPEDACASGEGGNASACSIADRASGEHPGGGRASESHGAHVSQVAREAERFLSEGLISEAEKRAILAAAGASDRGKK
jgi:hypothetical protein